MMKIFEFVKKTDSLRWDFEVVANELIYLMSLNITILGCSKLDIKSIFPIQDVIASKFQKLQPLMKILCSKPIPFVMNESTIVNVQNSLLVDFVKLQ